MIAGSPDDILNVDTLPTGKRANIVKECSAPSGARLRQDLVLIPGLLSHRSVWRSMFHELCNFHSVYTVQTSGFAGSPAVRSRNGVLADLSEEIAIFVEREIGGPATIVGHSMGGIVALHIAKDYPEVASSVIVVDAVPWPPSSFPEFLNRFRAKSIRSSVDFLSENLVSEIISDQIADTMLVEHAYLDEIVDWEQSSHKSTIAQSLYELYTDTIGSDLYSIKQPVSIIAAWHPDQGISKSDAQTQLDLVYGELENYQITIIPNTKHFIMFDDPDAHLAAIFSSLQATKGGGY